MRATNRRPRPYVLLFLRYALGAASNLQGSQSNLIHLVRSAKSGKCIILHSHQGSEGTLKTKITGQQGWLLENARKEGINRAENIASIFYAPLLGSCRMPDLYISDFAASEIT